MNEERKPDITVRAPPLWEELTFDVEPGPPVWVKIEPCVRVTIRTENVFLRTYKCTADAQS